MNIKKYIVSAAMGFGLLGSVGAQASNNYAISCHGCGDIAKKSTLEVHLNSGFPEGHYNFFVIDMINTNVSEFEVSVPAQNFNEFGSWSQPATVTQKYRSDQELLNRSVKDVKDAIKDIEAAIAEITGERIVIPESSGYLSAYAAVQEPLLFNNYLNHEINTAESALDQIRNGKLKLELLASNLQVGISSVASVSLTFSPKTTTTIVFADETMLKIYITIELNNADGLQINVNITTQGTDKDGNLLPMSKTQLQGYNGGAGGFNASAFQGYFSTKGITVNYGSGTNITGGSGGGCETKWSCSADGKVCTLETISGSC